MPASASPAPSVPFPVLNAPHANGAISYQLPGNVPMRPQHRHGHSADHADPSVGQKPSRSHVRRSEQIHKPLPTRPEQDNGVYLRPSDKTPAEQYKERSLQKLEGKEGRSRPLPDQFIGQSTSGSVGRRATVDAKPSSGSNGVRRKPVQTPTPQEFFNWADEPQVISTPIEPDIPTGSHRSRNRHMGVYRDAPPTWSKGTAPRPEERQNLSASVGHQPPAQPTHFTISSSSLGRHHSASASVPSTVLPGSARSTFATAPTGSSSTQKIPYSSTSTTPTPKAQTFNNIGASKSYKHISASNQDLSTEERRRKLSHHRTASASTQAASPSSCSTTGSSHCDTWRSATSQNSHRQRPRGISDAPAPQTHYIGTAMGLSEMSVGKVGGGEDRGRKREKEETFIGRIRTRSNSLTKSTGKLMAKVINYPKYLRKGDEEKKKEKEEKRQSKQQGLGQSNSAILAPSTSDNGHSLTYSYTSSSTATTTSTNESPISPRSQSVQPRPKKLLSPREKQQRNEYRASPMTRGKEYALEGFVGVDLPSRMSGIEHTQVQVSQSRWMPMAIPLMDERQKPRRK